MINSKRRSLCGYSRAITLLVLALIWSLPVAAAPDGKPPSASSEPAMIIDEMVRSFAEGRGLNNIERLLPYGDEILQYLPAYLNSPDARVNAAAQMIASLARSEAEIPVLIPYMRGGQTGLDNIMFADFGPDTVRKVGGGGVRDNLIWRIARRRYAGVLCEYLLLLSSYQNDAIVISFLKGLQQAELDVPARIMSLPPILYPGDHPPRVVIPDLGAPCCPPVFGGSDYVPFEFVLHLALAELHQKPDEEAVLWRLRGNDLPSIMFTVSCARYVTNKRLLEAMVELVKDDTLTNVPYPNTVMVDIDKAGTHAAAKGQVVSQEQRRDPGSELTEADYMRVCDYTVAMLASTLQVDVGIPDLAPYALKKPLNGYKEIDYESIGPVRRYTLAELGLAYASLKAAVDKMPDK